MGSNPGLPIVARSRESGMHIICNAFQLSLSLWDIVYNYVFDNIYYYLTSDRSVNIYQ